MGETQPWSPVWISLYRASCLTLEQYRAGRVLLAGDAAHLVPIFGVRGLNSGVDDTANLAWKLGFVLNGLADERLLDTYSTERVFATRENMRHASKSAEFMAPPSPVFRLMREAALSLAVDHPWIRRLVDPRQSTSVGYPGSPLNDSDEPAAFAGGPAPGFMLVDAPIAGAGHLSDLIGPHFTLLAFDSDAARLRLPEALGPPVRVIHAACTGEAAQRYDARPGTVYLLRPDGHVLARWREADAAVVVDAVRRCCAGGATWH
jgi:3-(3-hydroxy-phenyl)propionate hydroxylase